MSAVNHQNSSTGSKHQIPRPNQHTALPKGEPHQTGKNAPELLYSGSAAPPRPVPGAGAMLISRKSLNNAFLEDGEKAEDAARLVSRRARDSFIVNTLFCGAGRAG